MKVRKKMSLDEFLKKYYITMNIRDIEKIEDKNIVTIKMKYSKLVQEAFLDEKGIPDSKLEKVVDEIKLKERDELINYYKSMQS